jgi:hypothetical protein
MVTERKSSTQYRCKHFFSLFLVLVAEHDGQEVILASGTYVVTPFQNRLLSFYLNLIGFPKGLLPLSEHIR